MNRTSSALFGTVWSWPGPPWASCAVHCAATFGPAHQLPDLQNSRLPQPRSPPMQAIHVWKSVRRHEKRCLRSRFSASVWVPRWPGQQMQLKTCQPCRGVEKKLPPLRGPGSNARSSHRRSKFFVRLTDQIQLQHFFLSSLSVHDRGAESGTTLPRFGQ